MIHNISLQAKNYVLNGYAPREYILFFFSVNNEVYFEFHTSRRSAVSASERDGISHICYIMTVRQAIEKFPHVFC